MNVRLHEKEIGVHSLIPVARLVFARRCASRLGSLDIFRPGQPGILSIQTKDYAALLTSDPIVEAFSSAEDEAWLFYTSGTTGHPKGAVLSFRNLQFMSHCYYADVDHLDEVVDVKPARRPVRMAQASTRFPIRQGITPYHHVSPSSPTVSSMQLEKHQHVTMRSARPPWCRGSSTSTVRSC